MTNSFTELQSIEEKKLARHQLFGSVIPGPKSKPTRKEEMADLQNTDQDFLFKIDAVGISNVKYPIVIESTLEPKCQTSIGTFTLTSSIDRTKKGTNMSRFLEQIERSKADGFKVDFASLHQFSSELGERLEQNNVAVEIAYPWFYERKGPSSALAGLNHGDVTIKAHTNESASTSFTASLAVFVTTLCPCSKEISEYSAHSQRGKVTMEVTFEDGFSDQDTDWKKTLLEAAESNASAMIHPLLKRVDEKVVTETAYENPRFVEDMVRLVAADLYETAYISKFKVTCENEESIHLHNAIATIEFDKNA